MVDEVHERTLFTDILLGLLKKVLRKRKDLRLIVSSATVDADQLFRFFNHNATKDKTKDTAAVVSVEGRNFPVDVFYLQGQLVFLCKRGKLAKGNVKWKEAH